MSIYKFGPFRFTFTWNQPGMSDFDFGRFGFKFTIDHERMDALPRWKWLLYAVAWLIALVIVWAPVAVAIGLLYASPFIAAYWLLDRFGSGFTDKGPWIILGSLLLAYLIFRWYHRGE